PAEHYSVLKRPEYKDYQASTNIFFPGKPKN
ncbi:MAG: steroid 5-alpha reductase family enzyme, partial [Paraglaciecola sp.]